MLFVVDTNTLASAVIKPLSLPARALLAAQTRGVLLFSEETKSELLETMPRTKFDKYLLFEARMAATQLIIGKAEMVEPTATVAIACRDSKDIKFLRLAFHAKAACLISGDKDLTSLHPFHHLPLLSPADFITWLK